MLPNFHQGRQEMFTIKVLIVGSTTSICSSKWGMQLSSMTHLLPTKSNIPWLIKGRAYRLFSRRTCLHLSNRASLKSSWPCLSVPNICSRKHMQMSFSRTISLQSVYKWMLPIISRICVNKWKLPGSNRDKAKRSKGHIALELARSLKVTKCICQRLEQPLKLPGTCLQ